MWDDLGLAHVGDAGVAVAVVIMVIVVAWSARAIALAWLETIRERNTREHERELQRLRDQREQEMAEAAANQAIADALQALKKRMESDAQRQDVLEATTRSLITSAKQLSELIEASTRRTAERSAEVDRQLEAIRTDVQTVPAEVWRLGDPKLDGVLEVLSGMETRLLAKLQPGADAARQAIRDEFGDLVSRIRVLVEYLETSSSPRFTPSSEPERGAQGEAAQDGDEKRPGEQAGDEKNSPARVDVPERDKNGS